jgi:hypothetical protein
MAARMAAFHENWDLRVFRQSCRLRPTSLHGCLIFVDIDGIQPSWRGEFDRLGGAARRVIISSGSFDEAFLTALHAGSDYFLYKPVSAEHLQNAFDFAANFESERPLVTEIFRA